ncbi:hypothetical protein ABFS82_14G204100 [Erythranthe guttata]|uniref:Uncharacterized protein n=1 Tax=Erythranthe guttata TaxID=4155 RepID=A0A022PSV6_ERYGU|nr:hypothetical protein MIMGU_mgv1a021936mg [Erythranthe guttata]
MRQRELLDFRTPQHPSMGKNNWGGGASPLLARNLPKESLDQRYLRLNAVRDRDRVFSLATIEDEIFSYHPTTTSTTIGDEIFTSFVSCKTEDKGAPTRHQRGLLWKLTWRPYKRRVSTLGSISGGSKWFPKLNSKKRWPNGWC